MHLSYNFPYGLPHTFPHILNLHISSFPSSFPNKYHPVTGEFSSLFLLTCLGLSLNLNCFSESILISRLRAAGGYTAAGRPLTSSPLQAPLRVSSNNNARRELFGLLLKCSPTGKMKRRLKIWETFCYLPLSTTICLTPDST